MNDFRGRRTDRLDLTAVTSADVDVLYALNSDERVWSHFPSGRHRDRAQTAQQVAAFEQGWQRDGLGYWIARLRDGTFVGVGGCATREGVGWNLYYRLRPEVQGHGYATELVSAAMLAAATTRSDLPIYASLLERNVASRVLAERTGLTLRWRGPDVGPDPHAVRLVYADRPLSDDALSALGLDVAPATDARPPADAVLDSVNIGVAEPNPFKPVRSTGIDKTPQPGAVSVRDPGPRTVGLGSGLVGDHIGDVEHHGGSLQAVYAFTREDLDAWQVRLARDLPNGFFGENLTTRGLEVNDARIGERWRIGETVELRVTSPRIPCATFRGWVGEPGWLKLFTRVARPGAYLAVVTPGVIRAGDRVDVTHRPTHDVTVGLVYRATTLEPELLPSLLAAGDDLHPETMAAAIRSVSATSRGG